MADQMFGDAKIIYELFTKRGKKLDEAAIDQLAAVLNLSTSGSILLERVKRLEKGMPVEDKFISLALWMGNCKLIHKLEQEQLPKSSINFYQVPDLFAIFNYKKKEIPVLIEVKSKNQDKSSMSDYKFRLSNRAYQKLVNYSKKSKLPLLIAWQAADNWALFDIRQMRKRETAYHISWNEATSEDLMFILLGNLWFTFIPRVKLKFELNRDNSIDSKNGAEETNQYHLVKQGFENAKGKPMKKITSTQRFIWSLADQDKKDSESANYRELIFETTEDQKWFPAYALLPYFLFWLAPEKNALQTGMR